MSNSPCGREIVGKGRGQDSVGTQHPGQQEALTLASDTKSAWLCCDCKKMFTELTKLRERLQCSSHKEGKK